MKFLVLSIALSILSVAPIYGQEGTLPAINKNEISQMLKQLSSGGQISNDDMIRAQKELEGYSQDDIDGLSKKAVKLLEDPSFQKKAEGIQQMNQQEVKELIKK